jgi:hypothetical protein
MARLKELQLLKMVEVCEQEAMAGNDQIPFLEWKVEHYTSLLENAQFRLYCAKREAEQHAVDSEPQSIAKRQRVCSLMTLAEREDGELEEDAFPGVPEEAAPTTPFFTTMVAATVECEQTSVANVRREKTIVKDVKTIVTVGKDNKDDTFEKLGLKEELLRAIKETGFEKPMEGDYQYDTQSIPLTYVQSKNNASRWRFYAGTSYANRHMGRGKLLQLSLPFYNSLRHLHLALPR